MSLKTLLIRQVVRHGKNATFLPAVRSSSYQYNGKQRDDFKDRNHVLKAVCCGLFGSAVFVATVKAKDVPSNKEPGGWRPDLPTYRAEEVQKHSKIDSFWVIYKDGVYDVTKFLPSHPGGEQILNAGGLSVEPFWNLYGMHKTTEVFKLLESYRIGNIHPDDVADYSDDEIWAKEPYRDQRLLVKTQKPFNAEIPAELQIQNFETPNELFYVRQHMPVPEIDAKTHKLSVKLVNKDGSTKQASFGLEDLAKFPQNTISAALMCAGNRRSEMTQQVPTKDVKGIAWKGGAISNAEWSGVYLTHILKKMGVDEEDTEGKHIIFTGSDIDATGVHFSTSIPLHQAVSARSRVLLATRMNGCPLPLDHGYPLRVIVPGAPAVRSVKWLESITISTEESPSHWHQKDYRSFNSSTTWQTAHFPSAPPVYSLPVTSAVCQPSNGDTVIVTDNLVRVKGYAYSGGGARVLRVDVSGDGGATWVAAPTLQQDAAQHGEHYAWTLWSVDLPAPKGSNQMEIWVKATDSNFNTQPEKFDDIWNIRGILSNAYHKIKINIKRL